MISIVMAYYDRLTLLEHTLRSFNWHGYQNYEVVITDDGSPTPLIIHHDELQKLISGKLSIITITKETPVPHVNPCVPYNVALSRAQGDIIILQNPECFHLFNVMRHVKRYIAEDNYITYGAYSLDEMTTQLLQSDYSSFSQFSWPNLPNSATGPDGTNGWYNHSRIKPRPYHFCSAITRTNIIDKLHGFDERYANGVAFDDDELLHRIRLLGLEIQITDFPSVLHQFHEQAGALKYDYELYHRNEILYRGGTSIEESYIPPENKIL